MVQGQSQWDRNMSGDSCEAIGVERSKEVDDGPGITAGRYNAGICFSWGPWSYGIVHSWTMTRSLNTGVKV